MPRMTFDVFVSFRGKDTRRNFTDHLYTALVQAGGHTYRDNDELPRGEEISSHLLKAIHGSKISIVVFSKGYATSTWCLEELANIMECRNTNDQVVLPVFYDIDPSDVRKQKRSFAEAFQKHEQFFKEDMEKVNRWRKALREASTLSGWDLNTMANRHESDFIRNIVKHVMAKLGSKYLYVPEHLVGIDSHVDNIIALLRIVTDESRIVGIHGMGGIGKTTLAKVVFNLLLCEFEGSSFLSNVSGSSKAPNGLVQLQNQLLCDTLKTKNIVKINNVDRGMILITERLCYKRVLVVIDDVDNEYLLTRLVGENRFGPGSVIIVTSRNEHLLTRFAVHVKYEAKLLTQDESLQLFSRNAFRTIHPPDDYAELSKDVLKCARGLPLALEVLGASLFREKNKSVWRSAIEKLRKTPDHDVQAKLKISFDALDDDTLKNTFLDIACFFVGRNKEYVSAILNARYRQEISLKILVERSLLEVNLQNQLRMHDLVRDMGREIVYQMCPQHPGKRSRIWPHEEAWEVLKMNMGTKKVEGLVLDVQTSNAEPLRTESFENMKYLHLLQINGVRLKGCYRHLPNEII